VQQEGRRQHEHLRLVAQLGHADSVESVAYSPDGKRVLTGSGDRTARLWGAETGALLHILEVHHSATWMTLFGGDAYADANRPRENQRQGAVMSVAFSPDGAAERLLGAERVHIDLYVSPSSRPDSASRLPSKTNLRAAFEEVQQAARSTDVLVVFLSGHGVDRAGNVEDYHYLTCEAADSKLELPQERERLTISGKELAEWLAAIPANKQAVILDTCAAGKASDSMTRRNVTSDMRRAWERLKDRAGVFVLAGCAADAVSYELSDVGQGLLTYALLEGLARGDSVLRADPASPEPRGYVDVERLLGYAEDRVPQLVRELGIGGIQKPELKAKRDARSFDVGLLTSADRLAIPLALPRPIPLRPEFEEQERPSDSLELTRLVEAELRGLDPRGREAPAVFWPDVAEHPRAYQLRGRYRLGGERVEVDVFLSSFEVEGKDLKRRLAEPFRIEGRATALPELARRIVDEAQRRLATLRDK
jgi:hypothetical protein